MARKHVKAFDVCDALKEENKEEREWEREEKLCLGKLQMLKFFTG